MTGQGRIVEVRRIWDHAPHNAFTDLVRYRDRWWCVFREGESHVSPDGVIRVLMSADGVRWESAALLASALADLRDPKLTITPDGRFMICCGGALHDPVSHTHRSYILFSSDGRHWEPPIPVADPDFWLWRVSWHKGTCYGVAYASGSAKSVRLYRSDDGQHFETLVETLHDQEYPNETSMVFLPDDTALCLLRRDPAHGLLGRARPPYTNWTWRDAGCRIGGPHMLRLADGRLIAGVRLYDPRIRTSLCWVNPATGTLTEFLELPSGGDTSYGGLVWHDGLLWVSYYSSHEAGTAIYLAQAALPPARGLGE